MAEQGRNPDQPGRIEVGLSFLSAQESAAFREMKEAFTQAGKMFEAMKATDFLSQAQKFTELTQQMNTENERRQQAIARDQEMQQRGGGIRGAIRGAVEGWRAPTQQETSDRLNEEHRRQDEMADRANRTISPQEHDRRERLETMSDEMREAERLRRTSKLPPGIREQIFPSVTGVDGPDNPLLKKIEPLRGEETGMRIPRYGELNIQDLFNELRDRRMKQALEATDPEEAQARNKSAGMYQYLSDRAGQGYAIQQLFNRARAGMARIGERTGFSLSAFDTMGASLGYRRGPGQDLFGIPLPFQTPFSPAGAQGERMWRDTLTARFLPGTNKEQAEALANATAQAGFSGQQGTDVMLKFMQPLQRQFGLDPQTLIPFTQVLRTGTGTIADLSKELGNLGELARTARVDVNTMAQALAASGEAAQQAGGYFQGGVQFGSRFSETTGLTPDVGNQLLQNNTVQALLAGATGLPTFASASAPAGAKMQATTDAINMYYQAYASNLGEAGATRTVNLGGGRTATVRGDNPASTAVGSMFGISADAVDKIRSGQGFQANIGRLEDELTAYEQQANRSGGRADPASATKRIQDWINRDPQRKLSQRWNAQKNKFEYKQVDETTGKVTWREDTGEIAKQFSTEVGKTTMDKLNKDPNAVTRDDLVSAAHRAGIKGKELGHAVDDAKTPEERVKRTRALIAEKAAEEQAKYQIAFTGPAAKFFKALVNNNKADFGKVNWDEPNAPANTAYGSTAGPANLSDVSNSGLNNFNTTG